MVADSGASDHVQSKTIAPEIPIKESPMSRAGKNYKCAGKRPIKNEGQQNMPLYTMEGVPAPLTVQIAAVRRPLCSVSKICDRGNRVTFCRNGGYVQNLSTGRVARFRREGGIYALDFWLGLGAKMSDAAAPFPRQG